ncbi:MAG: glycosyltransferase family 2 protein [Candidatus Firestonebacteria bacterium]
MKVSLVIFSLNEIDGMKAIMPQIKKEWYDELIIVDGGSTDGTIEYAKENGYFIFIQKEKGTGAAFAEAMEKVTGDIVVIFSPDGNSIPEAIPKLVDKMKEGYDMVIASRYLKGAKSYDDDRITSFGNWMFTTLINVLFGAHYTDSLVMYRAFKKNLVKDLNVYTKLPAWGSSMLIRATRKKLKVTEISADEPKRIGGERKMQPLKNGLCELTVILKEFFTRNQKNGK